MEIQLSVPGDGVALLHLHDWLRRDDLTRRLTPGLPRGPTPPAVAMGTLDVVNVILSNSIAFTSLAVTLANWRTARELLHAVRDGRCGSRAAPPP